MFIFSELLRSIAHLFSLVFHVLYLLLIIRMILSWVNPDPYNGFVQIVYSCTEFMLAPFRRLGLSFGGLDFSPILAFITLSVVRGFIVGVLHQIANRIG